ncbi:MAG: Membrane protein [Microbacteriaceae bacterium]|nr:Membrane protein [Microbacteriaceae bacterium]
MPTIERSFRANGGTIVLTAVGALGVLASFIATVAAFVGIESASGTPKLIGADNELGYPSSAFAMVIFVVVLAVGAAQLSGARLPQSWWTALVVVFSVGVVFVLWAAYLAFTWLLLVQLLLMAVALAVAIRRFQPNGSFAGLGVSLTVLSTIGFFAAFRLTVDKVGTFTNPTVAPSCNLSVLVSCGKNLGSWQGSLFGFPNPLLGIGGWIAVFVIGALILSGVSFARWFWIAMNVGVAGALALIIWLIYQSIFALGTLCPWCMATWAVTIPGFWLVTLHNLRSGNIPVPARARSFFATAYTFIPLITLICFVVIAIIAQLRLDVIHRL